VRIVYLGTGDIGLPVLERLLAAPEHTVLGVVTQPDKPVGRRQEMHASPVKELALRYHVPIFQPAKIRDPSAVAQIQFLRPDVIVVMAYGQILPRAILNIPSVACLNLHASLLPRHRGAAPIQAAIECGDRDSGITIMYMAEGLDTGDILLKRSFRIGRRETGGSLHERIARISPDALLEALLLLKQGRAPRIPQQESEATHAPKLTREHGEIQWSGSRDAIDRKIRAMNPWPSAYTWLPTVDGARKLKSFSCIQSRRGRGPIGDVLRADKNGILVACAEGAILLREVQLEGKRRMTAKEFLLGHPVAIGTKLGVPPE
jgi:methionyl-tRNA formyltransferase